MYLINKIKKLRAIDIFVAAVIGILAFLNLMFHSEIQALVNTHLDIAMSIVLICAAILFGEDLINVGGAIMLYLVTAIGVSFIPLWLEFPPIVVVITMFVATGIASIAMLTMPSKGSPVERFFHRRKLVFNVKLVSY